MEQWGRELQYDEELRLYRFHTNQISNLSSYIQDMTNWSLRKALLKFAFNEKAPQRIRDADEYVRNQRELGWPGRSKENWACVQGLQNVY